MVNYQNGKIYKIVCHTTGKVYVGSTTKEYLSQRLAKHVKCFRSYLKNGKNNRNYITSYQVLENNNYEIMLLELCPCSCIDELHLRERFYTHTIECVNKVKNQGIKAELGKKEYDKQKNKEYREKNKDLIKEKQKVYHEKNKESHKEYNKQYREKNKEAIKQRKSRTYTCDCGSCLRISDKAQHDRTKKHQDYLKSLETVEIP